MNTTKLTSDLLTHLDEAQRAVEVDGGHKVHVSELASLPAFIYEKVRNIVDYKDEYLLRKNAVRRFLKRSFAMPKFTQAPEKAALSLVRDLILSRYVPNDSVPESTVVSLQQILTKYYTLWELVSKKGCDVPRWREMVYGLAAVECDAHLVSPAERSAYVTYGYRLLKSVIQLPDVIESEEMQSVELVIQVQKVMERADRDIVYYSLLRHYYPDWFTLPPHQAAEQLAPQLAPMLRTFGSLLEHRLSKRLMPAVKRLLVPLMVFRDMLHDYKGSRRELVNNPHKVEELATKTYSEVWQRTRRRIRRKGFNAMAYIFITKMTLALLFELPYERFILHETRYVPLWINLLFPPFLMLVITLMIKSPTKENALRVVHGVQEMLYNGEALFYKAYRVKTLPPKLLKRIVYGALYVITMGASFGLLVSVLWKLGFNLLSGALFIFFVSLVSFFGISLRQQARQLKVIDGRETLTAFVVDFFTLPVVAFGKWLSTTFDKVNVFVFILDYLFEIPFKSLLKMIEEWFAFLKEKKEEMY